MRALLAAVFLIGVGSFAIGQESRSRIDRGYVGEYLASIPDPEKLSSLLPFALNASVANEIGLTIESRNAIEKLLLESGGSLSSPSVSFNLHGKGMSLVELQRSIDFDLVNLELAAKISESTASCRAICSNIRVERLRQIVYQIEIERVGLSEALSDGFLSKRIGLEDNQRPVIRSQGKSIARDEEVAIKRQLARFVSDLSEVVNSEQYTLLQKLLGDPFVFRDDPYSFGHCRNIPDPNSILAAISLVPNASIASELRMEEGEVAELTELLRNSNGSLEITAVNPRVNGKRLSAIESQRGVETKNKENLEVVYDILDPRQRDRLGQLVYHVEIARTGLSFALTKGHLGKNVGITEEQKPAIAALAEELERSTKMEIAKIRENSKSMLFLELSPIQRIEATKTLGKSFLFRDTP